MWIVILAVALAVLLMLSSISTKQKNAAREEKITEALKAEYQRIKREEPDHPDAQYEIDEFLFRRKQVVFKYNKKVLLILIGIISLIAFPVFNFAGDEAKYVIGENGPYLDKPLVSTSAAIFIIIASLTIGGICYRSLTSINRIIKMRQ